jgi:adenylate kinase
MISLIRILKEMTSSPKAIILAGAPGAGKSTIIDNLSSNIKILNIDNYFIKNLKDLEVSLDLKNADPEDRSKSAVAMQQAQKSYQEELEQEVKKLKSEGYKEVSNVFNAIKCLFIPKRQLIYVN